MVVILCCLTRISGGPRYCVAGLTLIASGSVQFMIGGPMLSLGNFVFSSTSPSTLYDGRFQTLLIHEKLTYIWYEESHL